MDRALQFAPDPPAGLALSVAELKAQIRIDAADEDALLAVLVAAAVDLVEQRTARLLTRRAVTLTLPAFPTSGPILLRGGVVAAQPTVTWRRDGVVTTMDSADLEYAPAALPPSLTMAGGVGWPSPDGFGWPVSLSYSAGYAPDGEDVAANVPAALKQAVALLAAEMYARREQGVIGAPVAIAPVAAEHLMAPYIVPRMG